jgi:hypothetical protein
MSLKKGLVLGIAMVLVMAAASAAMASSIRVVTDAFINQTFGVRSGYLGSEGGDFSYEPTMPGAFSLTFQGANYSIATTWWNHHYFSTSPPEPSTFPVTANIDGLLILTQDGPLRFSAVSWSATLANGTETLLFHDDVDADLITNGGYTGWNLPEFEIGQGQQYTLSAPADPSWPDYFYCVDYVEVGLGGIINLELTGTVVDTTAPVPLPSTLVLLGSGLVRLALYRKKKLVCRS